MFEFPHLRKDALLPILQESFDGIALAAPRPWRLIYANPTLASWLRQSAGDLCDKSFEDIFSAASRIGLMEEIERVRTGEQSNAELTVSLQLDGEGPCPMRMRLCHLTVDNQSLIGIVLQKAPSLPASESSKAERRDPLTDLPDRAFLLSRLTTLLQGDRAADRQFAVLFVDLDNFKQINDGYGHLIGDRVLREVAQRLSDCLREGDHVTRFGGDEFVVLLERVARHDEIEPVIGRIRSALAEPIVLPEGEFTLSLSIGVGQAAAHHRSPEDVLQEADREMYAAKRAGV